MNTNHKYIIAGGGTGGHIFPAVAIGHAIRRFQPDAELLFVGAMGKMEMEKIPAEGFKIVGLDIAGFNRSHVLKNLSLPLKILRSARKAKAILKEFQPDVVIGVGGYASYPMLRAAQQNGTPTLIQEQNSYAGKTNRMLGKKALKICAAYEELFSVFEKEKVILTGNPVRHMIVNSMANPADSKKAFGLSSEKKTLLIVGGSLGAASINRFIASHLKQIVAKNFEVIWQTGNPFVEEARKAAQPFSKTVWTGAFIKNMDEAYAAADIVISRAGALAIAELCIVGKPVIFVPYPFAAEDHQTKNAMSLVDKSASLMVPNSEINEKLWSLLNDLMGSEKLQRQLGQNIKTLAIKDADERIVNEIFKLNPKTEKV